METLLIFAVLLLFFGAKRLPDLASGMGRGIRDFKRALNGLEEPPTEISPPPPAAPAVPTPEEQKTLPL